MYDQLPFILELQKIDGEIDKLEKQKTAGPISIRALDAELSKYKRNSDAKSEALEEFQKQRRSKDRDLILQQSHIDKYKSQRTIVKTNKEYTALEFQISEAESAKSKIEDGILEIMIVIDTATKELESAKNELNAQEKVFEEKKARISAKINELDQHILRWNKKRDKYIEKINPSLLSKYDNWRKRRGTHLVAVIEGQTCGGCHLSLPPQLINEVRKKEQLHTCNSCGRILYWVEEVEIVETEGRKTKDHK
jgi:predicted  nucleic acid-binding Zn-ribbon protein